MRAIPVYLYAFAAGLLPGQTQLYISNAGANNLPGVVNPETNTLARIFSSGGDSNYLAVSAKGTLAYNADPFNIDVAVIDTQTDSRLATIPMPGAPGPIVLTGDEAHAYVGLNSSVVAVIDTNTNAVTGQIVANGLVYSLAASRTTPRIYIGSEGMVELIDTTTNSPINTVWLPVNLKVIAITPSPDGSRLYLCGRDDLNGGAGYLLIFDVSNSTFIGPVPLGGVNPVQSGLAPDGNRLYVSLAGALIVMDAASGQVIANVQVPGHGNAIAVKPDGTAVYMSVNEPLANTIYAFSTPDLQLIQRITGLSGGVNSMAFATPPGVTYEAEAEGNVLAGKASVVACSNCSGLAAVAGVSEPGSGNTGGTLTFTNVAGNGLSQATVAIYYQPFGHSPIAATITVNGTATTVNFPALPAGAGQGRLVLAVPGERIGTVSITGSQSSSSSSLTIDRITVQ